MVHSAPGSSAKLGAEQHAARPNERTPVLQSHLLSDVQLGPLPETYGGVSSWEDTPSPLYPVLRKMQDHCHYEWIAVLLSSATLVMVFVFVFVFSSPPVPRDCVTPFGQFLGGNRGVMAFSNCNRDYQNLEEHFVLVKTSREYSGVKWRAVEYARRFWLLARRPAVKFLPVQNAEEIWTRVEFASYLDGKQRALIKYANGVAGSRRLNGTKNVQKKTWSHSRPRVGDLLVYASDKRLSGGHVAVVVGVSRHLIGDENKTFRSVRYSLHLAEQNWDNQPWANGNTAGEKTDEGAPLLGHYARTVELTEERETGRLDVRDAMGTVLGWVRV